MPDAWYYSTPEEQIGPVTLQELKETLPTLPNAKDVYIWHDTLPEWIRAGDLAEIVARASAGPLDAETSDSSDNGPDSRDGTTDTKRDLPSLGDLHPDRTYAITMPASTPETGTAAIGGKRYSVVGLLVGAALVLLGCGLVYVGFAGALRRASHAFELTGAFLFVVGLFVILFRRRKTAADEGTNFNS